MNNSVITTSRSPDSGCQKGLNRSAYKGWEEGFETRLTSATGLAGILGNSLLMRLVGAPARAGIDRAVSRLGFGHGGSGFLFRNSLFAAAISAAMILAQRITTKPEGEEKFSDQWIRSTLYSLPAMLLGGWLFQQYRFGVTLGQDLAVEPLQAATSVLIAGVQETFGFAPALGLSIWERFKMELGEGVAYLAAGRPMGAIHSVGRRLGTGLDYLAGQTPEQLIAQRATFENPAYAAEIGAAGRWQGHRGHRERRVFPRFKETPISQIRSIAAIHAKQFTTPHRGKRVRGLRGVVTAVHHSGFWLQEPSRTGDGSFAGIYVRTRRPRVRTGDLVRVNGTVSVFTPDKERRELSQTQLDRSTYSVVEKGKLPEPVLIGEAGRMPPKTVFRKRERTGIDLEASGTVCRPEQDAIAFYRSLEHMRVRVRDARVVGASSRDLYAIAIDGGKHLRHRTPEGLPILMSGGPNTDVLSIDFQFLPPDQRPHLETGDRIVGDLVGVLDYSSGQYRIRVTEPVRVEKSPLRRETVTTLVGDDEHFTVASSNFENFSPTDPKRTRELAEIILTNMKNPDVIALQEGMSDLGVRDDGVTGASYERLNAEIRKLGGKEYQYVDGGKSGGDIRIAYLIRTDRISLKQHPSRIDPDNPAYHPLREPLVIKYSFNDTPIIQVNLHSISKRGDDSLWGRYQPPTENSGSRREKQHRPVAAFWEGARRLNPNAAVLVGGDLNAGAYEPSVTMLTGAGLVDLAETKLPAGANYTHFYAGAGHYHSPDHLLASPALAADAEIEILHLNSGRAEQFSDHDIKIARFRVPKRG